MIDAIIQWQSVNVLSFAEIVFKLDGSICIIVFVASTSPFLDFLISNVMKRFYSSTEL